MTRDEQHHVLVKKRYWTVVEEEKAPEVNWGMHQEARFRAYERLRYAQEIEGNNIYLKRTFEGDRMAALPIETIGYWYF